MTVDCGRPLASLRNDNPKFSRAVLQRTTPYGVGRCAFGGDPRTFALLYCPVFKELRRHVFVSCGSFDRVLALMCRSDADDSITRRIASQAIERSFRRPSLDESRRYVRGPTGSSAGRGRPNGSRPASRPPTTSRCDAGGRAPNRCGRRDASHPADAPSGTAVFFILGRCIRSAGSALRTSATRLTPDRSCSACRAPAARDLVSA